MSGIDLGEPVLAHSIDPIMKELEAAIKNSYQSEYEEFAKSNVSILNFQYFETIITLLCRI
jgi:hypothetical protein